MGLEINVRFYLGDGVEENLVHRCHPRAEVFRAPQEFNGGEVFPSVF
jgi:hypothetical protein